MRSRAAWTCVAAGLAAYLLAGLAPSPAQQRVPYNRAKTNLRAKTDAAKEPEILRFRELVWEGSKATVRTPEYRASSSGSTGLPQEWARIAVEYDTKPEWIDEVTFQYYVMALGEIDGKRKYAFYKTKVTYIDIEEGKGHVSEMYLRPSAVKRFGKVVAVGVEISSAGKTLVTEAAASVKLPAREWWKEARVVGSQDVVTRDGYLLNRSQTPFALLSYDAHEVIK